MKPGFFTDTMGVPSSTRVMAFELVNAGIAIGIYAVVSGQLDINIIAFSLSLITLGFTGKLISKPMENKANGNNTQQSTG